MLEVVDLALALVVGVVAWPVMAVIRGVGAIVRGARKMSRRK